MFSQRGRPLFGQSGVHAVELLIVEDLLPGWHPLCGPPLANRGPETGLKTILARGRPSHCGLRDARHARPSLCQIPSLKPRRRCAMLWPALGLRRRGPVSMARSCAKSARQPLVPQRRDRVDFFLSLQTIDNQSVEMRGQAHRGLPGARLQWTISRSPAAPIPPPTHIVITAYFALRRRPSIRAWPVRRAPVIP